MTNIRNTITGTDSCAGCTLNCRPTENGETKNCFETPRQNISDRCREILRQTETGELVPFEIDFVKIGEECSENCNHCSNRSIPNLLNLSLEEQQRLVDLVRQRYPGSKFFIYPDEIDKNRSFISQLAEHSQTMILTSATDRDFREDDELLILLKQAGITKIPVTLFSSAEEQREVTNQSSEKYERILRNIRVMVNMGFDVRANNILHRGNIDSIPALTKLASELGVADLRFTSFRYLGKARNLPRSYFLTEEDVVRIVNIFDQTIQNYRKDHLRIHLSAMSFGPNFYNMTQEEAAQRIRDKRDQTPNAHFNDHPYACSTVDNRYICYNVFTGDIHWCFMNVAHPELSIGTFDPETGIIVFNNPVDFTREILSERIHGICSKDECEYHESCLGMCRSTAYSSAILNGEKDPFYASMPWCQTKIRERLYGIFSGQSLPSRIRGH